MKSIRSFFRLPIAALSLFSFAVAFPGTSYGGIFDSCDYLPEKPRPTWVETGWRLEGHYVGVGQSGKRDKKEEQIEASKMSALNDLAQRISVKVTGSLKDVMTSLSSGSEEALESSVELVTETNVQEKLRDWRVDDTWLDRNNCMLWTLAVVSEDSVKMVETEALMRGKFAAMEGFYERGAGAGKMPGKKRRLAYLKEASAMLGEIDFAYLPDARGKGYYAEKFRAATEALENDLAKAGQRTAVITIASGPSLPVDTMKNAAGKMGGILGNADPVDWDCAAAGECLSIAGSDGFQNALLMKMDMKVEPGSMGGFKGTMTIEATLYEPASKRKIKGPLHGFSQVVGWTDESIDWDIAVEKIFSSGKFEGLRP